MAGWTHHTGRAVHLPLANVDTDQLIPARFMSVPRSEGYGSYLMHDLRRDAAGNLTPAFPLNRATDASVLIAGRNFGSGSSREAAVYALVDAGFRAVFAPSFGDIFASNAVNNGLLPAVLDAQGLTAVQEALTQQADCVVDLEACQLSIGAVRVPFVLEESWREKLVNGWDDIDLTLHHAPQISDYRARRAAQIWVWPKAGS